ncbi:hypothetical protein SUGI_0241630 [Cryptomeria japonica]|uniref:L-ascorbate oxidase homolog n=1 Tax=Cryptomeria japonica TaxID=3369 RepID=UPI002408E8EA|nr:L-ascorbate oxidase homolog [Cryptomeria japonica]GLJ14855.1 hypothetical protein SUGI_0241630 [Cryptomeria japonica]
MGCLESRVLLLMLFVVYVVVVVQSEDPYKFFTWTVTYGTISPLGVPQQGILINGLFPGPQINSTTNDNIVVNIFNKLNEPFLINWNGVQQRRNSWQDGVLGTNCPIPPGANFTYKFQVKDQIGSYFYFPSTYLHRAAGGFGGLSVASRAVIPVPYVLPDGEFTILIGDWFNTDHSILRKRLDMGMPLGMPDGVHINGLGGQSRTSFKVDPGKTYRLRISNVGLSSSLNFRIRGHQLQLVEVEGSHTVQNLYRSIDLHVGQSCSVLLKTRWTQKDYYMVASTRFTKQVLVGVGLLQYSNSKQPASGPLPRGPTTQLQWSINQAKSIRWNLTAGAARPNPQGSYHYGEIKTSRTIILENSAPQINGTQRYAVNGVSFTYPDTPLKLADYYKIPGVFSLDTIPDNPNGTVSSIQTAVMSGEYKSFIEIIFQNNENTTQSWHIDGYNFFVVGMDRKQWTPASRVSYNLFDAVSRCTTQVYPNSWTAILMSLDNAGLWNVRSALLERQYLGQEFYIRIYGGTDPRDEYAPPTNALLCGKAIGNHTL